MSTTKMKRGIAILSFGFLQCMSAFAAVNITGQPVALTTVVDGSKVTLQVNALSTIVQPLTYRWWKNGVAITTATSTSNQLVLSAVKSSDTASYYAQIFENGLNPVLSASAIVVVNVRPKITSTGQPKGATVTEGQSTSFTVTLDSVVATQGTPPFTYQWQRKTGTLWADIHQNANSPAFSDVFSIPSAQLAHAGSYRVLISNAAGSITSAEAVLKVNSRPILASLPGKVVTVFQSAGGTAVIEGGATDTYSVVLSAPPSTGSNVTVTPSVTAPFFTDSAPVASTDVSISPVNAVFTDANWNTPVVFTVTANDDLVANAFLEGAAPLNLRSVVIGHAVTSTDTTYSGAQVSNFLCSVTDNETSPRIVVTENSSTSTLLGSNGVSVVTEGGVTDAFTVAFAGATPPASDITVNLTAGARITTSPASLTFTAANFNVPQTVTITAVNDSVFQGVQFLPVSFATVCVDAAYSGLSTPTLNVRVNDNDDAPAYGVTVIASGGDTRVVEGGMDDELLVVLNKAPSGSVSLTRNGAGAVPDLATPGNLLFTTANWFIPQRVNVSATDDLFVEPTRAVSLNYAVSGGGYASTVGPVNVTVGDNDVNSTAGVRVVQSGTTDVKEGGATDSFAVTLAGAPTSNVSITLAVSPAAQASISGVTLVANTLTFSPANWNVAQTVTVAATDDAVTEGPHTAAVSFNLGIQSDSRYSGMIVADVSVNIADNDNGSRVLITQSGGSTVVTEGGAADYFSVMFTGPAAPSSPVTVTLAALGTQINAPSPASLTFNNLNWMVPQTVFVTAVNDTVSEGVHADAVTIATASADGAFNTLTVPNVPVAVYDNDSAGASGVILVTETDGSTRLVEGGLSETIFVSLRRAPTATVTLTPILTPAGQVAIDPPLTFTTTNWNVPQLVTLSAPTDLTNEGVQTVSLIYNASAAGGFTTQDVSAPLSIVVGDTSINSKRVLLTETGADTSVTEDGPTAGNGSPNSKDVYRIALSTAPTADVTITPVASSPGQVTFSPTSVTFTAVNFATTQNITVTAVSNLVSEADETLDIDHTVSSTDVGYNSVPVDPLSLDVVDDDTTAGRIVATKSGGGTLVLREDTGSDTIDVSLSGTAPTANVTVTLAVAGSQVQFFANGAPMTSIALTFTPANHTVAQKVTLISVDDTLVEGIHSETILLTTVPGSPAGYTDLTASLPVTILDNESVSRSLISIVEADGSTRVIEGGAKDAYSVVLRRAPTANVVLTPVYNTAQLTLLPKTLTFTSANWNIPQLVTAMAVDDTVLEGTQSIPVVYAAGNAGGFLPADTATINVQIGDNEGVLPALPPALNIAHKASGTLKITADGNTPLTYQWFKNGNPIPGAKSASLSIKGEDSGPAAEAIGPGNYYVEITNIVGNGLAVPPTRSNTTAVRVIRKPSIKTDLLATRGFTLPPAANLSLDVEAHTMTVIGADYGTLSYQWQKDGKNIGDAVILAPFADPRIIAGTLTRTLTITPVSWLDRGAYKVIISNEVGTITSKATAVSVTAPPIIVTQPINATGPTGGSVKFSVVAGGSTPLTYQWSYSPDNIAAFVNITTGKAATLTVSKLALASMGYYKCKVSHATLGNVDTIAAFLQVDNAPVVTPPLPVERVTANAAMAAGSALVQFTNPASVANFKVGMLVTHPSLTAGTTIIAVSTVGNNITLSTTNTTGFALNINAGNPMDIVGAGSLFILTGNNIHLKVSATGTNTPANPLIYTWQKNNVDILGGPNSDTLILPTTSTTDSGNYRCVVKNLVGAMNSAALSVTVQTAPSIVIQPLALTTVIEQSPVALTVTAAGSPTLTYKWQRNLGTLAVPVWQDLVPAKTTATLSFSSANLTDSGDYQCIVKNKVGTVTTLTANLTVTRIPNPTLGPIAGVSTVTFYPETGKSGEKVRLYGTNLNYALEVKFGDDYDTGAKATFVIESSNALLITIPPTGVPLTPVSIQVKNKGDTSIPIATTDKFTRTADYSNGTRYIPPVPPAFGYYLPNATIIAPTTIITNLNGDNRPTTSSWYVVRVPHISNMSITVTGLAFGSSIADPDLYLYAQTSATAQTFLGPDGVRRFLSKSTQSSARIGADTVAFQTTFPDQDILIEVQGFGVLGFQDYGPFFMSVVVVPITSSESSGSLAAQSAPTRKHSEASSEWTASAPASVTASSGTGTVSSAIRFGGTDTSTTEPVVLWNDSLDQSPAAGAVVTSFTMSLEEGDADGDDQFAWQVNGSNGDPLLALWVNASDGSIRAVEPNGTAHSSIQHMTPGGGAHRFEITVDPAAGTWITMMDGVPVTAPVPLPYGAQFGDISAIWDLGADSRSSGASIIFDGFAVESELAP